jgi:hypothetical protein
MSSIFKGLTEYFGAASAPSNTFKEGEVFIGQVLDVGKSTSKFTLGAIEITPTQNPYSIGMIRFLKANSGTKAEKDVTQIAEPLDRANYRLPFAGEQVLLVKKLGKYYYFDVVTPSFFLRNTIDPTLLQDAFDSSGAPALTVDPEIEAQRFALKNDFSENALNGRAGSFTRVREGDSILEGRMGGAIKFTHTITKDGIWNPETQITNIGKSVDGDPMLIMKASVRRREVNEIIQEPNLIEDDDINEEDSSFYLTTSQNVPIKVAASVSMSSWSVNITKGKLGLSEDPAARLQSFFPALSYDPNFVPSVNVSGLENLAYNPNAAGGLGNITGVSDPGVPGSSAKAKTFDEIKLKLQELGYNLPAGVHFVGIRSVTNINTNNSGVQTKNKFADLIGVVDGTSGVVKFFPATTVPGKSYLLNFYEGETRTAILKPGQYNDAFMVGQHNSSYEAFRQNTTFVIYTDRNRDDIPDVTPQVASGAGFGINLHRASANGVTSNVDNYSAGCQVFSAATSLAEFLRVAKASGQKAFTYTLLMSW